jgi:hypothetical protein
MKKGFTKALFFFSFFLTCFFSQAQTQHSFLPSQANSTVTFLPSQPEYAYINTVVPQIHKLFLFLPGSRTAPAAYLDILRTAANLGYNAVGIDWVNNNVLPQLCPGHGPTCVGSAEQEEFLGGSYSSVITVDSADAIRTRLIDALKYLNTTYPTEGWGQYLAGPDSIIWTSVCVSGHSQGAAIASHIAYWYLVDRGVFFATGGDWYTTGVAAWLDSASATPASRKYSFTHKQDERYWLGRSPSVNWAPVIWDTLGLFAFGNYISRDTLSGNYHGGHAFTSDTLISSTDTLIYHDCVIEDQYTPTVSGTPTFQPLWVYLLTDSSAITCTPSVAVSFTAPDTVCSNTVVSYTAVPTNGGSSPGYKWYNNGILVSAALVYNDSVLNSNDSVWVVMTSNASCASPATAMSSKVLAPSYNTNGGSGTWTWTGAKSTNWFEACNWDRLSLPDALSDVVVPGGTANEPTITGGTGFCKTITVNTTNGGLLMIATANSGLLNVAQ